MTQPATLPFDNLYRHGFVRTAVVVPRCKVADPAFNAAQTIALLREAAAAGARVVLFPELGLTAYTCDDLFHQHALLDAAEAALAQVVQATATCPALAVVGLPLRVDGALYNVAAVAHGGRLLGLLPKTYLPNYGEFYEARQFHPAGDALVDRVNVAGFQGVPFGPDLLFQAANLPALVLHAEICEDVWTPVPPSSFAAMAGATLLLNLSASNITVGKSAYRHDLAAAQSARCVAAYLYASAGMGESTTDLAWDGQALAYENGALVAESARFVAESHWISADIDLERLQHERMRQTSFAQCAARHRGETARFRRIAFTLDLPAGALALNRRIARHPYVPADGPERDARCHEVYDIQVQGLTQRLAASGIACIVIGISGGLDSTQALLVAARAMDRLGRPRSDILAVTMPGFATSSRTLDQARRLMTAVGCTAIEIDIRPSCRQMLADIGHPAANGVAQYDITFENVQAGERTSHLFRLANHRNGFVLGTGDLSELALGWCTYGVGDHMSHYNVNASVPKTLVRHLVHWVGTQQANDASGRELAQVLFDIADTEISPELVPATDGDGGAAPAQSTEDTLGPYELHDFSLYHTIRSGFSPAKVAWLAQHAFAGVPERDLPAIKKHLRTFLWRFFQTSQWKRSCVPNAPKVGSGGSLSPRGDWRAPSDGESAVWLADWARIPDA
ncbi:NAD(+) synthase [Ideonella sp. DXS22W]|uniref:Glutamine-dependent NAD(+) synthetase n=1 Tax=Pseudaquabacterium inlustre TaxID=2984192 RepID=A0ABU9CMC8_9BURK